ncbi:MFS transporter [Buttiauxella warmboldiae]|uniref:D-xylose-proton symporter n=1 Tax=Buttiauxella warmboldiae TaxID=82993 RepID=A0A3N5E5F9_9ENTR|nr:sugar porter family MFS transporter [Buttiauxella warmboldiae]RPH30349.1 MFS transporter [Buttiauxella warmboldiae]
MAVSVPHCSPEEGTYDPRKVHHDIWYVLRICFVAALGGFLFGFDTAVISGSIDALNTLFALTPAQTGWAVSNVVIGCVIGALLAGKIAGSLGRKKALCIAAILFIVSIVGVALSYSFSAFVSYRMIGGVAVGLASVVSPMYMSEVAPKDMRGRAVGMQQFAIVLGQSVVFFTNYLIARGMPQEWIVNTGWRWMFCVGIIPCIAFLITVFLIPESPRWNVMKGFDNRAFKTFERISDASHASHLVNDIKRTLAVEQQTGGKKINFRSPDLFFILMVGCTIAVFNQLTGINAIMYYAPEILKNVMGSMESALLQTSLLGAVFVAGNALGLWLIDKTGRVKLMYTSSSGCALGLLIASFSLYTETHGYLAVAGMMLFLVAFSVGWGVASWALVAEIFPNRMRSAGMGIAIGCQWIAAFIVAQLFPMISENVWLKETFHGAFPLWIFVGFMLLALWLIHRFIPETKGVSLERIEQVVLSRRRTH